jgi:hypothetical protein
MADYSNPAALSTQIHDARSPYLLHLVKRIWEICPPSHFAAINVNCCHATYAMEQKPNAPSLRDIYWQPKITVKHKSEILFPHFSLTRNPFCNFPKNRPESP